MQKELKHVFSTIAGFNINSLIPFLQRRESGRIIVAPRKYWSEKEKITKDVHNEHIFIARLNQSPPEPKTLRVGIVKPHLPHIPDNLPQFPDPHTYIKTNVRFESKIFNTLLPIFVKFQLLKGFLRFQTQIEFSADYESARIACATQQRNIEAGLVKFMRDVDEGSNLKIYVKGTEFKSKLRKMILDQIYN